MSHPTMPTGTPNGPWHPKTWAANADTDEQTTGWTPPAYPPVEFPRLVEPAPIEDPAAAADLAVAYRRPTGRRVA